MAENIKVAPIPLSELPEINEPKGFWIFGSKDESNGTVTSGKYKFDNLEKYAKRLQLERRLTINMSLSSPYEVFIGEQMTIYKVDAVNVSALRINDVSVAIDETVEIDIPPKSIVRFVVEKQQTDPTAYLYIYATVVAN
jgi:hypothetical protein